MTKIPMGFVALALVVSAAGCAGSEDSSRSVGDELRAAKATTAIANEATKPLRRTTRFAPVTGLNECDELLHVYDGCVRKRLSGEEKAEHAARLASFKSSAESRARAAVGQDALVRDCKQAFEALPAVCTH
jgi:hypothetical protein